MELTEVEQLRAKLAVCEDSLRHNHEAYKNRWSGFSDLELQDLLSGLELTIMCGAPGEGDVADYWGPLRDEEKTMVRELRLELVARDAGVFGPGDFDEEGNFHSGHLEVLVDFNAGVVGMPQAIENSWRFIEDRWGEGFRRREMIRR